VLRADEFLSQQQSRGLTARPYHRFDIDEFLPRRALFRRAFLGFLDLLPVAEGDDLQLALRRQRVEPGAAALVGQDANSQVLEPARDQSAQSILREPVICLVFS